MITLEEPTSVQTRTYERDPQEFTRFIAKSDFLWNLDQLILEAKYKGNYTRAQHLSQRKRNLEATGWIQLA